MELQIDTIETPIGEVAVVASSEALYALDFADCRERMQRLLDARFDAHSDELELTAANDPGGFSTRVGAYFAGELDALEDILIEPGGTAFQREVWAALRRIRPGTTRSYAELAGSLGRARAARAVGAANATNPVALAIPCHRVIGANGALTGYAGGVKRKRWLLDHELRSAR